MTWEQRHGTACDCAFTPDTYCAVGTAYMYTHKTHKGIYSICAQQARAHIQMHRHTGTYTQMRSRSKLPIAACVAPLSEFRRCLCKVLMCKHSNRHTPECTYWISVPWLTSNRLHLNDTMGYEVSELGVFISKANLLFFIMWLEWLEMKGLEVKEVPLNLHSWWYSISSHEIHFPYCYWMVE